MPKQTLNIRLDELPLFLCPLCGQEDFERSFKLKFIKALLAGNPSPTYIAVEFFRCCSCGSVFNLEDFIKFNPEAK